MFHSSSLRRAFLLNLELTIQNMNAKIEFHVKRQSYADMLQPVQQQ